MELSDLPRRPLVPRPSVGRTFTTSRPVRLGDVSPEGRVRLDAVARYLQDVAGDDAVGVMGQEAFAWIVRRTTVQVERFPRFGERLELTTWGSGVGSRWAERRTSIVGEDGGHIEAAALWIRVDLATGRPKRLDPAFHDAYEAAVGGREVPARLEHPDPPSEAMAGADAAWVVRRSDLDLVGHVNNAAYWQVAEEHWGLDDESDHAEPWTAEVEYRAGLDLGPAAAVVVAGRWLWIVADRTLRASFVRT